MNKILFIFLSFFINNLLSQQFSSTPLLNTLLINIKLYKLKNRDNIPYIHAGDLLEHSFWTMYAAHELIATNSPYNLI